MNSSHYFAEDHEKANDKKPIYIWRKWMIRVPKSHLGIHFMVKYYVRKKVSKVKGTRWFLNMGKEIKKKSKKL